MFVHTNLVAKDWRRMAEFYEGVFGCVLVPPERDIKGEVIDGLTGVKKAVRVWLSKNKVAKYRFIGHFWPLIENDFNRTPRTNQTFRPFTQK